MDKSTENCDRKPLIALWYLHKTTNLIASCSDDERDGMIRLQAHYLGLCRKYGVTNEQVADSLEITPQHAAELMAYAEAIR
jgi:hypothetical protein